MEIGFLAAMTARGGDIAEIARATEAAGFDSLWIPEHPVIPAAMKTIFPFTDNGKLPEHYGRWADPFVGLAAAAAVTKKIKLGTGICLIPERETLITAKTVASLDLLSGGRFLFGIGAGWLREETEAMGAKFGTRWKRTREGIEAMRALWSQGTASYAGELVRFENLRCEPRPVQQPGPPVILGAHGPKALERVARSYDGWMPLIQDPAELKRDVATLRKLLREQGRDENAVHISPLVDPQEHGPSTEDLKWWRDAGCERIVLLSQQTVAATADGHALDLIKRFTPVVERNRALR
ncbi:MAG TPA: LLM class F420-dependent oxidoreductase [Candidatus Binataceae bacterium]|nr:LLM class F420-dependent oxidoreductase [Candidatus Binataceae bacterium]